MTTRLSKIPDDRMGYRMASGVPILRGECPCCLMYIGEPRCRHCGWQPRCTVCDGQPVFKWASDYPYGVTCYYCYGTYPKLGDLPTD